MSVLERLRTTANAGLDAVHMWFFERETIAPWSVRRLLQTPEELQARPRLASRPLHDRTPEEAFRDRTFAAGLSILWASVVALWVLIAVRLFA